MPTYDYECTSCGHKFELLQGMTAKPIKKCPKCNKKVKRLIGSGSGIFFKGTGFYATDYRKKASHYTSEDKKQESCTKNTKEGCNACPHNK